VKRKINKAFCEPQNIEKNPLLDWAKHIIFPLVHHFVIPANVKWNEPEIIFDNFASLYNAFANAIIHPKRLKEGMIIHINDLLQPVRNIFENDKKLIDLSRIVKSFQK